MHSQKDMDREEKGPEKEILTIHTTGSQHKSSVLLYSASFASSLFLFLYSTGFTCISPLHRHLFLSFLHLLTPIQSTYTVEESECKSKSYACMPSIRYSVSFSFPELIHQRVNILVTTQEHLEAVIYLTTGQHTQLKSLKCRDSRSRKVKLTLRRRVELFSCISPLARFKGFPLVPLVAFFPSLFSCVISNAASLDTKRIREERKRTKRKRTKRKERKSRNIQAGKANEWPKGKSKNEDKRPLRGHKSRKSEVRGRRAG